MRLHRRHALFLAALGLSFTSPPSHAADRLWIDPAGGNFSDAGNWNPSIVPGPLDNAEFNLSVVQPYTVTLTGNVTNNRLFVRNDKVHLTSSGVDVFTYTLTSVNNPSVTVGDGVGSGELTLLRGIISGRAGLVGGTAASAGTVTLTGPQSTWRSTGIVTIGDQGSGTLDIRSDAKFEAASLRIGVAGTGDVIVQNGGRLTVPTIQLGETVEGVGTIEITSGGQVSGVYSAVAFGLGVGSARVEGSGRWTMSQGFDIGRQGIGSLEVLNGGVASASGINLGVQEGADGSVTVSGSGSQLTSTGSLVVGSMGTGTLVADLGGRITSGASTIGMGLFGDGLVELSDPDTLWTVNGNLQVGNAGIGELSVAAAARVTSTTGTIGGNGTGIALFTGNASQWTINGALEVGVAGSGTLEIAAGADVQNTTAVLGKQPGSVAELIVDGAGSTWNSSGAVQVGLGADPTGMTNAEALVYIQNGATASSASATVGAGGAAGGLGAVFVTGPLSQWTVTNDITVGGGVAGVLDITQGGLAKSNNGFVATVAGGSGLATITGAGSIWNVTGNLYVGGTATGPAGNGTLELMDSGAVSVGSLLRVWSTGTILFDNGAVSASAVEILGGLLSGVGTFSAPLLTKPATVEVRDGGTLNLTGRLTTDGGTLTKTGLGLLNISGAQVHAMPATLRVTQGTAALNTDAGTTALANLTVDVEGGSATFNTSQHLKTLQIDAGTARMPGSGKVLVTDTPSIAAQGQLDIDANSMVVRNGSIATVRAQLIAGRGSTGGVATGKWNGASGITSSAARLADLTSETRVVGYALNGELPVPYQTFAGQPVDADDVLVRFTKNGDANLDGIVNNNDITILAGFYRPGVAGKHWHQADLNYDGFVDNNDITILAGFYAPNDPPISPAVRLGLAAVPEPGALMLLLPLAALLRHRRELFAR